MNEDIIDLKDSTINGFVESLRAEDPEIRKQVDMGYSCNGSIARLHEIIPCFDNPEKIMIIKFT